jgi:hypothetical protein
MPSPMPYTRRSASMEPNGPSFTAFHDAGSERTDQPMEETRLSGARGVEIDQRTRCDVTLRL